MNNFEFTSFKLQKFFKMFFTRSKLLNFSQPLISKKETIKFINFFNVFIFYIFNCLIKCTNILEILNKIFK